MRTIALLFAAALAAPAQDAREDETVRALLRKLDDADFAVREDAFQALVKLGATAVPRLKEAAASSDSAEVKARATEALAAIDTAARSALVYRDPALVTAGFAGVPARKALEEIAKQAGVKLDGAAHAPEDAITLKLERASLHEALDRLCASLPKLTWTESAENVVTLMQEKHPAAPTAYAGPFRIRVEEVTVTRQTNFKETTVTGSVKLATDHQQYLKPLSRVRYEVTSAADETGAALKVTPMGRPDLGMPGGGPGVIVMAMGGMNDELDRTFQVAGFAAGASKIASLKGTATFSFPLEHRIVKFSAPETGDREEAGDFTIRITNAKGKAIDFEVKKAKEGAEAATQEELERRLDNGSFVLVDSDGKEHKAESVGPNAGMFGAIVVGPGGAIEQQLRYRATFPVGVKMSKELRFRFIDKTLEKKIDFELKNVKAE